VCGVVVNHIERRLSKSWDALSEVRPRGFPRLSRRPAVRSPRARDVH